MQPNTAMKSAEHVISILFCKNCKFRKKNLLQFQRYQIFSSCIVFWVHPVYIKYVIY